MSGWCCGLGGRGMGSGAATATAAFILLTPGEAGKGEEHQDDKQFSRKYPTGLVQFHRASPCN
jgi:hypothetical protein